MIIYTALWYTDEDLMRADHRWELQKRPYIVLQLNAAYRGVGNGSCGWRTDTMPKYWISRDEKNFKLRMTVSE